MVQAAHCIVTTMVRLLSSGGTTLDRILDSVDLLLVHNLLRRMLEALAGKPAPVRQCPMAATSINPAMAQEEGKELLAFAAQVVACGFPGPDQIADGLVNHVRQLDPGQLAPPDATAPA